MRRFSLVSPRRSFLFAVIVLSISGPLLAAWGTTNDTIETISAWDFQPLDSGMETGNGSPVMRFFYTGGEMIAGVHLPTGALIESITINSCNTNPTVTIDISLLKLTDPAGSGLTIAFFSVPANSGCGSTTWSLPNPPTVDNDAFTYMLDISMQGGNTLAFRSVKVAYRLQVSPSPAVPTFNDVPATDPGFRYIEALAAAGITSSCGGNNFCPDALLTRRAAAVFLARALGLNFPH